MGETNVFQEQRRKYRHIKGGYNVRGKGEHVWNPRPQQYNKTLETTNKFRLTNTKGEMKHTTEEKRKEVEEGPHKAQEEGQS
ncbi:hypothetical protein H5410_003627 [Solanum commersonii]|uniref:Uncharacterized protein n=1 Tax=Solanum commersonii TaxID=4109 RepID=A0A9J6B584_SOLCO|nr:hypothetical protein H5410_003627 [Solanum commersonii]